MRKPEAASACWAVGQAAAWVAAARAQAGSAVDRAALDTRGFRFAKINALDDPNYLPGVLKYGDLPALVSLSAPHPVWLAGEGQHGTRAGRCCLSCGGRGRSGW